MYSAASAGGGGSGLPTRLACLAVALLRVTAAVRLPEQRKRSPCSWGGPSDRIGHSVVCHRGCRRQPCWRWVVFPPVQQGLRKKDPDEGVCHKAENDNSTALQDQAANASTCTAASHAEYCYKHADIKACCCCKNGCPELVASPQMRTSTSPQRHNMHDGCLHGLRLHQQLGPKMRATHLRWRR